MNKEQKRIIVVLGMHRSGTSAITRGLKVLGVDLGNNLMPPASGENDKGFWEDLDVYKFNESLLAKLNSTWERIGPIEQEVLLGAEFVEDRKRAEKLLRTKLTDNSIFAFKDPRTTILLPFWQQIFKELDVKDSYLIVLRNPLDIADSLTKRDGFSREKGLILWIKHAMASLQHTQNNQRCVVLYEDMLTQPREQLMRIAKNLNLVLPEENEEGYSTYVNEFLSLNLRHNTNSEEMLDNSERVSPFVRDLHALLKKLSDQKIEFNGKKFNESWAILQERQSEFFPFLKLVDGLEKNVAQMEKEVCVSRVALSRALTERDTLIRERDTFIGEAERLLKINSEIKNSTSWKITSPLRSMKNVISKIVSH